MADHSLTANPLFPRGLEMQLADDVIDWTVCARSESMRSESGRWARRNGFAQIARLTDVTATAGALTYGTTGKYARIPAAAQYLLPVGTFGWFLHFKADRPVAGTSFALSSDVGAKGYGPFLVTLSTLGVLTVAFRKESDESAVAVTGAIAAGLETHLLAVYDPFTDGGTWSVHVNGELFGSVTGVGGAEQPMQDGPDLYLGLEWDPIAVGAVAGTAFLGAIDTFVLFAAPGRGARDTNTGGGTLLETLIKWSLQDWPNPGSGLVRGQWSADAISGAVLLDSSDHKNNGVLVGAPANGPGIARRVVGGQLVREMTLTSGAKVNVIVGGGTLYSETAQGATA